MAHSSSTGIQQQCHNHMESKDNPEVICSINLFLLLTFFSMLQEVYEKFDYNDLECQKRLICEVLKEEAYFGNVSRKMKSGFQ